MFHAANDWLKHNIAEQLLTKVRLTLLSNGALKHLLDKTSVFNKNCIRILEEVLASKENFLLNKPKCYITRRCCSQDLFNILVCSWFTNSSSEPLRSASHTDGRNIKTVTVLPPLKKPCKLLSNKKTVYLKGEVCVFDVVEELDDYRMFC